MAIRNLDKLQIKGGELKMYIRWCSLWNMADSILRARPISDWVIFYFYCYYHIYDILSCSDLLVNFCKYKRREDSYDRI